MSKKQRAKRLMLAAKKIFYGRTRYSCHAVQSTSKSTKEAIKYAESVGVETNESAFGTFADSWKYSDAEQRLARALAILMYREAVLAGEA